MQNHHPWVILFDIDGTLLTVNRSFNRLLLRELLDELEINYPDMEKDPFSGRTDHDIFTSFLVNHDFDSSLYKKFKTIYLQKLEERLNHKNVKRHDFAEEAINYFSGNGFIRGLLTGNYPSAAKLKLNAANIKHNFEFGAFGEFDRDRNRLPILAIKQIREIIGYKPDPAKFIVIGDTPRDIMCAQSAEMKCIAVTTGKFSREELELHKPDLIIDNLANPEQWFSKLIGQK